MHLSVLTMETAVLPCVCSFLFFCFRSGPLFPLALSLHASLCLLFLHQIQSFIIQKVDDAEEFHCLTSALSTLGVTGEEQGGLWRLLAALLHLGNIRFVEEDEGSGGDGGNGVLRLESPLVELEEVASMAGLPANRLMSSMRKKVAMTGRGSFLEIPLNATQAADNRNGLVKHIYGQVDMGGVWLL